MIVYINIIPFKKIIRNIYVHPAVLVNIPYGNPESEGNSASIYSGFHAYISKFIPIVSEKLMATKGIPYFPLVFLKIKAADCLRKIFKQVEIKISIFVVVTPDNASNDFMT